MWWWTDENLRGECRCESAVRSLGLVWSCVCGGGGMPEMIRGHLVLLAGDHLRDAEARVRLRATAAWVGRHLGGWVGVVDGQMRKCVKTL